MQRRVVYIEDVKPEWAANAEYRLGHKMSNRRELHTPRIESGSGDGKDETPNWLFGIPGHFSVYQKAFALVFTVVICSLPILAIVAGILGKLK